ncbi:MAG: 6-phosphofructokinase [Ilumatobacter sp.]
MLIPEIPYDIGIVAEAIARREERGARFAIVVVAEGALPQGSQRSIIGTSVGQAERLGGGAAHVAAELEERTGKDVRSMVLGHLLRGGTPASLDRLLGVRFGTAAVRGLEEGHRGVMVALQPPVVNDVPSCQRSARCVSCHWTATRLWRPATSASASGTRRDGDIPGSVHECCHQR